MWFRLTRSQLLRSRDFKDALGSIESPPHTHTYIYSFILNNDLVNVIKATQCTILIPKYNKYFIKNI